MDNNSSTLYESDVIIDNIKFADIFNIKEIQILQDLFSDACGVASIIINPNGVPITNPSNFCRLYTDVILETEKGRLNCFQSEVELSFHNPSGPVVESFLKIGLWDAGASISVGGKHIGTWIIGQVRNEKLNEENIFNYAKEIGANKIEFWNAINEVSIMSFEQFNKVAKMLFAYANELSEKAYNIWQLNVVINEREKAIALLNEERQVFSQGNVVVFKWKNQENWPVEYVSSNVQNLLGFSKEEIQSSQISYISLIHSTDINRVASEIAKNSLNHSEFIEHKPFRLLCKKGDIRWVSVYTLILRNIQNEIISYIGYIVDITELKQAELKNKYLSASVENSDDIVVVKDLNFRVVATNQAFANASGHASVKTMIGKIDAEIFGVAPDSEPVHTYMEDDRRAQKLKRGEFILREEPVISPNGDIITVLTKKYPIFDDEGNLFCTGVVAINITESKLAEAKIKRNLNFTQALLNSIPTAVFFKDKEGRYLGCNDMFSEIMGVKNDEIIGKKVLELWPDEQSMLYHQKDLEVLDKKEQQIYEDKLRNKKGEILDVIFSKTLFYDENGEIAGIVGTFIDITERKKAEVALKEQKAYLRLIIDTVPAFICVKNLSGIYELSNKALADAYGTSIDNVEGHSDYEFSPTSDENEKFRNDDRFVIQNKKSIVIPEEPITYADSSLHWLTTTKSPIIEKDGSCSKLLAVAMDITERKETETKIQEMNMFLQKKIEENENHNEVEDSTKTNSEHYIDKKNNTSFINYDGDSDIYSKNFEIQNEELRFANSEIIAERKLYNNTPIANFLISKEGEIIRLNLCGAKLLNKEKTRLIKSRFSFFVTDHSKAIFNNFLEKVFESNKEESCEITLSIEGKLPIIVILYGIAYQNDQCQMTLIDITERKLAEEDIFKSEQQYRHLIDSASEGIFVSQQGYLKFVNPMIMKMTGFTEKELLSIPFINNIHPDDKEMVKINYLKRMNGEVVETKYKFRIFTKDKTIKWFEISGTNGVWQGERATICFVSDITERKIAKQRLQELNTELEKNVNERNKELLNTNAVLRQTEEKYRIIADFTHDWEAWVNPDGSYNYVSPACERITGYPYKEFINDPKFIYKIIYKADKKILDKHVNNAHTSSHGDLNSEFTFRIITKTGKIRWIEHVCRRIYSDGKYLGVRTSNRDITEKVKVDNELLNVTVEVEERERNHFARELHDGMGPLLSTIKLYFQWLSETDDAKKVKIITEKGNNNIDIAIQATRDMAKGLSSQFLNKSGYIDAILNFIQIINDTNKLTINFIFNSRDRFYSLLETILYRITTELINNTVKHAKASLVEINYFYLKEDNIITFTYSDNGIGFDMTEIDKTANGLGLNNIQQRLKIIRGNMTIDTSKGKGMKIYISLPVNDASNEYEQ